MFDLSFEVVCLVKSFWWLLPPCVASIWIAFRSTWPHGIFWGDLLLPFRATFLTSQWGSEGWQICKSFVRGHPPRCGVMMSVDVSGDVSAHRDFTKGSRCSLTGAGMQVVRKTAFYFHAHADFVLNSLWALPMAAKQPTLLALPLLALDEFVQNLVHSQLIGLMDKRHARTRLLPQTRLRKIKEQSWSSWGHIHHGQHLGGG